MKKYKESKLENGLTIISCEEASSETINFNFVVKAGARYETKEESGYAHLLEHTLLKGTKNKPTALDISLIIDRAGAYLNASTSAEQINVILEAAKERKKEMLELLTDIITDPLFDPGILENEKKVVIQEIHKMKDDPARNLWYVAIPKILGNHPAASSALGTERSVLSATPEKLKNYYHRFFKPSRIALISAGAISHDELLKLAVPLEHWQDGKDAEISTDLFLPPKAGSLNVFEKKIGNKQTLIDFIFVSRNTSLKEELILDLISTFLTYGHSSLLYQELRHKLGLVYSVSSYRRSYRDVCIFYTQVSTTEPEKIISVVKDKILGLEKYFTKRLFEEIKEQQINVLTRNLSNNYFVANTLASYWIIYNRLIAPAEIKKIIKSITYEDVMRVKREFLNEKNLSLAILGDKEVKDPPTS